MAIVSGIVPTYLDVAFNYATLEFTEDNWLKKARNAGYRQVTLSSKIFGLQNRVLWRRNVVEHVPEGRV